MNRLKEFFWLCAGANKSILTNCPSEASKYVGIGATIFFTGIFASISSGYALYTVFDNYLIAFVFSMIWGLMIFNLDRFIVSSMRKNGDSRQEWMSALPRIILAIIISIVIAKPLELKIFEKEVDSEISLMIQEDLMNQEHVVKERFIDSRTKLLNEIQTLKQEIETKTDQRDELRRIAQEEADGTGGSKQRNAGPIYQIKKADADRVESELNSLVLSNGTQIEAKEKMLSEFDYQQQRALNEIQESHLTGLASRMEALSRLTEKSSAIWAAHWFIMFLFLAIETAPVFVKLISQRGPYDFVLKKEEYGYEAAYYEDLAKVNAIIKKRSSRLTKDEAEYIQNRLQLSLDKT